MVGSRLADPVPAGSRMAFGLMAGGERSGLAHAIDGILGHPYRGHSPCPQFLFVAFMGTGQADRTRKPQRRAGRRRRRRARLLSKSGPASPWVSPRHGPASALLPAPSWSRQHARLDPPPSRAGFQPVAQSEGGRKEMRISRFTSRPISAIARRRSRGSCPRGKPMVSQALRPGCRSMRASMPWNRSPLDDKRPAAQRLEISPRIFGLPLTRTRLLSAQAIPRGGQFQLALWARHRWSAAKGPRN